MSRPKIFVPILKNYMEIQMYSYGFCIALFGFKFYVKNAYAVFIYVRQYPRHVENIHSLNTSKNTMWQIWLLPEFYIWNNQGQRS